MTSNTYRTGDIVAIGAHNEPAIIMGPANDGTGATIMAISWNQAARAKAVILKRAVYLTPEQIATLDQALVDLPEQHHALHQTLIRILCDSGAEWCARCDEIETAASPLAAVPEEAHFLGKEASRYCAPCLKIREDGQ